LARCTLDISNERFQASVGEDAELRSGLIELRDKVIQDNRLSGFFNQPMPGFPEFQNKIWKWDFAPEGEHSSSRKGWRLFAYVSEPNSAEPILAIPFYVYPKSSDPGGNAPKNLNNRLRKFLAATVEVEVEERFRHQNENGGIRSLCLTCFGTVIVSSDISEVEAAEANHHCSP
jgi:hypothetical protein